MVSIFLLIGLFFTVGCILYSTYYVQIDKYEIVNQRAPMKIAHISDIHGQLNYLNGKLSKILNRYEIDFLVVTGDLTNNGSDIYKVIKELKKVNVRRATYLVLGNNERLISIGLNKSVLAYDDQFFHNFNDNKLKVLINEYDIQECNGAKILFYGYDNSIYGNEKDHEILNEKFDYKVVLAHSPQIISYMMSKGVMYDMLLVGHTHGKQMNIPFIRNLFNECRDYHMGYENKDNVVINISRGLGTSIVPIRINAYPQITIIEMKK